MTPEQGDLESVHVTEAAAALEPLSGFTSPPATDRDLSDQTLFAQQRQL